MKTYVGHNIRFYRDYQRLTQPQLATRLKILVGKIKSYEGELATPNLVTLVDISELLDVSLDTLVREKLNDSSYLLFKKNKHAQVKVSEVSRLLENIEKRLAAVEKKIKK